MKKLMIVCVLMLTIEAAATNGLPVKTIYVDTSGIDARVDLTATKKTALKNKIINDIKANYEDAVGTGKVIVTKDPTKKAGAHRIVEIKNTLDPDRTKPGWGRWKRGGKTAEVFLKEFMDDASVSGKFKTGGNWDTNKLGNALGHTSGHEVGHSYSVGHNKNLKATANKMTKGGLKGGYTPEDKATKTWRFDAHSKKTIKANWAKPPCKTEIDYEKKALITHYHGEPSLVNKPEETGAVDVLFGFSGALASEFELGWLGSDSDGGAEDGNADFDFIYKSSMLGDVTDAELLTFFEDAHHWSQLLLRGAEATIYEDQWFILPEDNLILSDFVDDKAKFVTMNWETDGLPGFDVVVTLDARNAFGADSNPCNGFTYEVIPEPATLLLLGIGGLALIRRRKA